MPREIWNEGRVTGLSAYEIYVKQHVSEDPDTPPASEREWLASSIAMGSSMLLKVPNSPDPSEIAPDDHSYIDIRLPSTSRLAAANTIYAQFYDGTISDAAFDGNWATKITDYGQLISNVSTLSPSGTLGPTDSSQIPTRPLADWGDQRKTQLKEYLNIIDGVVIQPGTWVDSSATPPTKDLEANLGSYPTVRLHIRGKITSNPLILLTGFTIRGILSGTIGTDGSVGTAAPEDGDFLGPAVFPWAARIMFSVPTTAFTYLEEKEYKRLIQTPTGSGNITARSIRDLPIIDMQASNPHTFYDTYAIDSSVRDLYGPNLGVYDARWEYGVSRVDTNGEFADGDGAAVLTVYQKSSTYPPALYGSLITQTGTSYLNPIDVVAPGSVKMFREAGSGILRSYEKMFPGTTALQRSDNGVLRTLTRPGKKNGSGIADEDMLVAVSNVNRYALYHTSEGTRMDLDNSGGARTFTVPASAADGYVKQLADGDRPAVSMISSGKRYTIALTLDTTIGDLTDTDATIATLGTNISYKPSKSPIALIDSNSNNDLSWSALLYALRNDRAIDILGSRLKSAKESLVATAPYLEFGPAGAKTRLYISSTAPDISANNIPEGSIGIGWGLSS